MLKCAKNHGNLFSYFEDMSRQREPSNVVVYFFGPPCSYRMPKISAKFDVGVTPKGTPNADGAGPSRGREVMV